jgi:hypothetical protein
MLSDILDHMADRLEDMPETGVLNNRRVIVVDGPGVTMPDTTGGNVMTSIFSFLGDFGMHGY